MKNKLSSLFKLIELTRSQPQYGWGITGLSQYDQSNLAEHHYLVTFIAWQLALMVKKEGSNIDVLLIIEYALIHDLGELFGGDISMPYAKVNPKARTAAKQFETENTRYLSSFFISKKKYQELSEAILDAHTDEALIAKIADYIELAHFKDYKKLEKNVDDEHLYQSILTKINKIKDDIAKRTLISFIETWHAEYRDKSISDILEENHM